MFIPVTFPVRDRRKSPVRCECGMVLGGVAGLAVHRRGVMHLEGRLLGDLLRWRGMGVKYLSLAEIGRRLGISRERVRQIASKLST